MKKVKIRHFKGYEDLESYVFRFRKYDILPKFADELFILNEPNSEVKGKIKGNLWQIHCEWSFSCAIEGHVSSSSNRSWNIEGYQFAFLCGSEVTSLLFFGVLNEN